ncbi:hypothetical protein IT575_03110 [bacterium]|nr:hypothetical protein [bacterium]
MSAALSASAAHALQRPITAMLLWQLVLSGRLDSALLALLGIKNVDVESVRQVFESDLAQLELLVRGGELPLEGVSKLVMGMLAEKVEEARVSGSTRDLSDAMRAYARLPMWIRNPELDRLECEARSAGATARIIEAHARREQAELQRLQTARLRRELSGANCAELAQLEASAAAVSPAEDAMEGTAALAMPPVLAEAPPAATLAAGPAAAPALLLAPLTPPDPAATANVKTASLVTKQGPKVKFARPGNSSSKRRVHR